MLNDLLGTVSKELNIPQTTDNEWVCQLVYSVVGQMALASLFDRNEMDEPVSIQHFKNRMLQLFDAYEGLFPQITPFFPRDKTDLLEDIYSIYLHTGFLYHSAFRLCAAVHKQANYGNVVLDRNPPPDEKCFMSGLGFYRMQIKLQDVSVADVFGLQMQSFESYLEELLAGSDWETVEWPDNTEFLRVKPPYTRGYWQQNPDMIPTVSLARYGEPNKIYVLYRYSEGRYQQKTIPEWRLKDWFAYSSGSSGEYRRIAVALLKQNGTLPDITVRDVGNLKEIKLGYRLPPSEEAFFKLYSWPLRYDYSIATPPVFTRRMAKQFYPIFKHQLQEIGYGFVEV